MNHMLLIIEPTRCTNFSNFYFGMKLYMFRTVSLSIIRSFFLLYTQQWYIPYGFADNLREESGWDILILLASCQQTCVIYNTAVGTVRKLLMTDRGTVRNM